MLRSLIAVLTVSGLYACVPGTTKEVETQNTQVIMVGTFRSNGGSTDIYFGNISAPVASTNQSGSYRIEIPRGLIEKTEDRRLYFVSSEGEAGVSAEIKEFETGLKTVEPVYLSPTVDVQGIVSSIQDGIEKPEKEATIKVGRVESKTDEEGRYSIKVPRNTLLPVEVQKKGFVITRGNWLTTDVSEERPFTLYSKLEPQGRLVLPVQQRLLGDPDTRVPLYIESTPSVAYVRLSTSPLALAPELDGSWVSLKDVVSIKASDLRKPTLYYQFADSDKKVVSGVNTLSLMTTEAVD